MMKWDSIYYQVEVCISYYPFLLWKICLYWYFIDFYDPDGYYFDVNGKDEFGGYYDERGLYHPGPGNIHEFNDSYQEEDEEDELIR